MAFFLRKLRPPSQELDKPWRTVIWTEAEKQQLLRTTKYNFKTGSTEVNTLRMLLHGPVGAGKSSFFNSMDNVLQDRIITRALAGSLSGKSFTMECKQFNLRKKAGSYFPFTFTDIRGMEQEEGNGVHPKDIPKILLGHVKNGYICNAENPISEGNPKYNENPSLNDRIHCLVAVIPANSISLMEQIVIDQLRKVRQKARDLGIPQVIIMTKVDEVCPLVKGNLEKVYASKKIKEKFNQVKSITKEDPKYNKNPLLKDKIHCLVAVLPADTVSMMNDKIFNLMRDVQVKARDLGIPQVIIMTKVDKACPQVKENLEKSYRSKKIKQKMEVCSIKLGVPVDCIFPVKNYHEERTTDAPTDILILDALQHIVNFA